MFYIVERFQDLLRARAFRVRVAEVSRGSTEQEVRQAIGEPSKIILDSTRVPSGGGLITESRSLKASGPKPGRPITHPENERPRPRMSKMDQPDILRVFADPNKVKLLDRIMERENGIYRRVLAEWLV